MTEKRPVILIAEDDEDFLFLSKEALQRNEPVPEIYTVQDGEEAMDYLLRRGKYQNPGEAPRPGLILLDLNMPKKDGRETLKEIKSHPDLKQIPVVVVTTSQDMKDVALCYELGANSFIRKPVGFNRLVALAKLLQEYWFRTTELPRGGEVRERTAERISDG
jgi:CheY-like chemotaxis protein